MAEPKVEDITRYGTTKHANDVGVTRGEASEYNIKYEDENGDEKTKKEKIHVKVTNKANVIYDDKGKPTKIDILPDKRKTELYRCEPKNAMDDNYLTQERIDNGECLLLFTRDESDEENSTTWQADQGNLDKLGTKIDAFENAMAQIPTDNTLDKDIRNTVKNIQEGGNPIARKRAENGTTDEDKREHLENVAGQTDPDALKEEGATATTAIDTNKLGDKLVGLKGRTNYGALRYPIGDNNKNDFIKFSILEYVPRKFSQDKLGFEDRQQERQADNIGTITLPVPAGIKDSNQVDWGDNTMSPLQAAFADSAFTATGEDGIDQSFKGIQEKLTNSSLMNDTKTAVRNIFAGRAVGVKNLVARTQGAVINPNLELLFNGPKLRQFSFVYLLTPRDKKEADEIINIIRSFKQASSVQKTDQLVFLKAPHTFQVTYHRGDTKDENPYIGKMKECAMTSVGVEYTPANVYATFEEGYMTQYRLTLTMQELEPVYNTDYKENTNIGY